jgi:hypothetical protein
MKAAAPALVGGFGRWLRAPRSRIPTHGYTA